MSVCEQVNDYITKNLFESIKYIENKNKIKINLKINNSLIIPDYEIVLRNTYISLIIVGIIFILMYNYCPTKNDEGDDIYNKFYLEIGLSCIIPGIIGTGIIFYYITKIKTKY